MKKSILFLMGFVVLFLVATISYAMVDVKVFDNTFVRGTGAPVTESKTFPGVSGKAIIKVYNGGLEDAETERVSSSVIKINGQIIFDQSNFNQNVISLEKEITINEGQNTLEATLKSKPGGKLTIQIVQAIVAEAAAVIGPEGGVIEVSDQNSPIYGAKLIIPAGALSTSLVIQTKDGSPYITENSKPAYASLYGSIELNPHGLIFNMPISVVLPMNKTYPKGVQLPIYLLSESLGIFEDTGTLGTVTTLGNTVAFEIGHFSVPAVGSPKIKSYTTDMNGKLFCDICPNNLELNISLQSVTLSSAQNAQFIVIADKNRGITILPEAAEYQLSMMSVPKGELENDMHLLFVKGTEIPYDRAEKFIIDHLETLPVETYGHWVRKVSLGCEIFLSGQDIGEGALVIAGANKVSLSFALGLYMHALGIDLCELAIPGELKDEQFVIFLNEQLKTMVLTYSGSSTLPKGFVLGQIWDDIGICNDVINTARGVPNALVTVSNANGFQESANTYKNGFYFISDLAPGAYQVKAEKGSMVSESRDIHIAALNVTEASIELPNTSPMISFVTPISPSPPGTTISGNYLLHLKARDIEENASFSVYLKLNSNSDSTQSIIYPETVSSAGQLTDVHFQFDSYGYFGEYILVAEINDGFNCRVKDTRYINIINIDSDKDGKYDDQDNCPFVYNPYQENMDNDFIGDACDADADGDGYISVAYGGNDCKDLDSYIYPGATEICGDGIIQDCNRSSDLSCNDVDNDGDGYTITQGDCNDYNASIHPGAPEICDDGIDNNCDGQIDEGCILPDTWQPTSTTGAPAARLGHTNVWTGTEMIVWGGSSAYSSNPVYYNTGGKYDPITDTWLATSTLGAPSGRAGHTSVWTGSEMIVWGGGSVITPYLNTGGRYNPSTDSWSLTSIFGAPSARGSHSAIWTGSEMIIWGGSGGSSSALNTGGKYNPFTNTWVATSTTNAPSARAGFAAVWSGNEMIVWGGQMPCYSGCTTFTSGGKYNPLADTWQAISTTNAPMGLENLSGIWTGTEAIFWGGSSHSVWYNTGGRYNPATDSWVATSLTNAPDVRSGHATVWTGSEMIVWGGTRGYDPYHNTGGIYNPISNSWHATTLTNAPAGRGYITGTWTGSEMIIWGGLGGNNNNTTFNTGGRYTP